MDKLTYLAELAEGLARWVPERERQDILRYYAEYFEEAGPDREAQVVQELGDPWALSCRLAVEGGYVSQEQAASWTPPKKKKWPWVVAGVAVVVVCLIGTAIASAVSFGLNIAKRTTDWVFSEIPVTAVVDVVEEDTAQWGTASEEQETYIGGSEGFWSMEDGSLEMFESIDVDISLGNVTVTGGEDFTIVTQQGVDLNGYGVKWEVKGGTLKIRDGGTAGQVEINNLNDIKNMLGGIRHGLDVIITVPDGFELEKVNVKTSMGDIFLSELWTAVKVEAETGMGNVECYEVRTANKIDLESSMGNVTFGTGEMYGGMEVKLETSMGNVEAQMGCMENECDYELKTSMGEVTLNGSDRGTKAQRKGGDYKLEAKSDMGDVNVYFYEDRW